MCAHSFRMIQWYDIFTLFLMYIYILLLNLFYKTQSVLYLYACQFIQIAIFIHCFKVVNNLAFCHIILGDSYVKLHGKMILCYSD